MKVWICILGVLAAVALALLFIALGMKLANKYNEIAWEKYYEGQGKCPPSAAHARRSANG